MSHEGLEVTAALIFIVVVLGCAARRERNHVRWEEGKVGVSREGEEWAVKVLWHVFPKRRGFSCSSLCTLRSDRFDSTETVDSAVSPGPTFGLLWESCVARTSLGPGKQTPRFYIHGAWLEVCSRVWLAVWCILDSRKKRLWIVISLGGAGTRPHFTAAAAAWS